MQPFNEKFLCSLLLSAYMYHLSNRTINDAITHGFQCDAI